MKKKKSERNYDPKFHVENEFRCDNIFKARQAQPYLDSAQAGKWGRGKDDSAINAEEYPENNNPLPQ